MTPVLFMLCSGFFHFTLAANRLRFFTNTDTDDEADWKNGLAKCKETYKSLITQYDVNDANFINFLFNNSRFKPTNNQVWLGLHMGNHSVSTWSDGSPLTFNKSHVNVTNGEQICEAIVNNMWEGFNCSDRKAFMCHKDDNYFLVDNEANWCQAHQYCRKHHSDLVSITNETQNQQVVEKGKGATFWIGLMHDEWKWVDDSCSTYRRFKEGQGRCATLYLTGGPPFLHKYECNNMAALLCSKGSVRIVVIQNNLTWEQAFDYCKANHTRLLQIEDENDQEAVVQWLNYTDITGRFWIGLRQSRIFGFWIWSDKTVSYSKWRNNEMPAMPLSNDCGVINKADNYTWSDETCWLQLPFICEEDIVYMTD